ncbi:MAG: C-GCAxxG-C-C family protein [Lawsonibacter sp.]|nr:C-GCAxxG-C-C family protein [Lawsonibacter sp.]
MDRADYAVECFSNGYSCSQAVFTAYCEDYGIDKKLGLKLSCPLGGGMGHTGQVCGAVSGALLVLGLKYGQDDVEDKHSKTMNYLIVKDFINRFKALNGSTNCSELIQYDLSDDTQLASARQAGVFKTKCCNYVSDVVKLLVEISSEYDNVK